MKKLILAIALIVVGLGALGYFALTANVSAPKSVPVVQSVQIQPKSLQVSPSDTAPVPEAAPAPVAVPPAPEPWYVVIAGSVKEIASAMVALAGAIMALVEVLKKLKEQKAPPAAS